MNSKDLPVTEYWDPEFDVYDVPLSPFEDFGAVPLEDHVELWWAAYEHQWLLGWIMSGEAAYIPARFAHQLTTGPGPCRCGSYLDRDGDQQKDADAPDCPVRHDPMGGDS